MPGTVRFVSETALAIILGTKLIQMDLDRGSGEPWGEEREGSGRAKGEIIMIAYHRTNVIMFE